MLPDGRYVTDEDAARQIKVTPITFRRWLAVGTMPQCPIRGNRLRASVGRGRLRRGVPVQEPAPGLRAEAGENRGVLGQQTERPRCVSTSGVPTHA